jgi:hypothetical protein
LEIWTFHFDVDKLVWQFKEGRCKEDILHSHLQRRRIVPYWKITQHCGDLCHTSTRYKYSCIYFSPILLVTHWKRNNILWKSFFSLSLIFVVSTKCIDPWVLEFVVSNITGNHQWENCITLDFNFRGFLCEPRNPRKLELIMISQ